MIVDLKHFIERERKRNAGQTSNISASRRAAHFPCDDTDGRRPGRAGSCNDEGRHRGHDHRESRLRGTRRDASSPGGVNRLVQHDLARHDHDRLLFGWAQ